jgi:hypothetical protein
VIQLEWLVLLLVGVGSLRSGRALLSGAQQPVLIMYRRSGAPAVLRNQIFTRIILGSLLLPAIVATAPLVWIPGLTLSSDQETVAFLGIVGYLASVVGLVTALASRPPTRLIPRWVREEDERLGYVAPRADWFDGLLFVAFSLFAICGIAAVLGGLAFAVDPGLFGTAT